MLPREIRSSPAMLQVVHAVLAVIIGSECGGGGAAYAGEWGEDG